jgi:hypothetical protein
MGLSQACLEQTLRLHPGSDEAMPVGPAEKDEPCVKPSVGPCILINGHKCWHQTANSQQPTIIRKVPVQPSGSVHNVDPGAFADTCPWGEFGYMIGR